MNRSQRQAKPLAAAPALAPAARAALDAARQHHQAGGLAEAERLYQQVLALAPGHADTLHLLGVVQSQLGRAEAAVALIGRAIAAAPAVAAYHSNLGNALRDLGRAAEAEASYRRAIALRPDYPEALNNLGAVLRQTGQSEAAIQFYRRALALRPDYAEAHNNLGIALSELSQLDDAAACFRRAIAAKPGFAKAHNSLGSVLREQGQLDAAVASFRQAIALRPDSAEAHHNLGAALLDQGRAEAAAAQCREALARQPDFAEASNTLGLALADLEQLDAAVASYRNAIALRPEMPHAHGNLGAALMRQQHLGDAVASFRQAIACDPDAPVPHFNLGLALISQGNYAAGWPEYEWRWQTPNMRKQRFDTDRPQWRGEAAEGRTLLIHAEQGFGDTLQFCRLAPLAAARGLRVVMLAPRPLLRLLRTLPGVAQAESERAALPDFDLHCPMLSLPLALGTTLATVPAALPYLAPDPAQATHWSARLCSGEDTRPRVGLVWAGNPGGQSPLHALVNRRRSIAPALLAPLFEVPGVRFVSLQKGGPPAPEAFALTDPMAEMTDFADTAALIANLDLVISVDTAVAHLAGALGKPVWLLDRFDHCWRWLAGRADSPWYPAMRIFRQPALGDWTKPIAEAAAALRELAASSRCAEAQAMFDLGAEHARQGRHEAAIASFRRAAALRPGRMATWYNLGASLAQCHDFAEAAACFRRAIAIDPGFAPAHNNLGAALRFLQADDEAGPCFRRAVELDPAFADALTNLGLWQADRGECDEAIATSRRAVAVQPERADGHIGLGKVQRAAGQLTEAVESFRRGLAIRPDYPDAHIALGVMLMDLDRSAEAVDALRRALDLQPDSVAALNNLGNALRDTGQSDESAACYRRALALKPDFAEAWTNLGLLLHELGDTEAAASACRRAIAVRPDFAEAHSGLGHALQGQQRLDEAIACYRHALELQPGSAAAHVNLAMALLAQGDMAAGWPEYEWRWGAGKLAKARRDFAAPQWRGEPAAGRTLLIHAEQGFGDTLQFCRYVPMAAEAGLRVVLEVPGALVRLLRGLPGVAEIVPTGSALPDFDLHCPMLSLPLAFASTLDNLPAGTPYLHAAPALAAAWQARIAERAGSGLRVGLVWAGSDALRANRRRSLPLERLAPILGVPGVQFFSLQKTGPAAPEGAGLIDFMPEMADFADTAALIANLDLVIAVDTAIAHLAAALGKPVWLLDRFDPCWRWMLGRSDSPWYPTLRIFRQPAPGDWDTPLGEAAGALRDAASDTEDRFAAGLRLHAAGRIGDAIAAFRRASLLQPHRKLIWYNLGTLLAQQGKFADAAECFRKAAALDPNFAEAFNNLGSALRELGRSDAAAPHFRRALHLRPNYPEALNNLGLILTEQGEPQAGTEACRRALALQPNYVEAHVNLGNALRGAGRLAEAAASYRSALALDPGNAGAHHNLALALLASGDFAAGWPEYEWRWQTGQLAHVRRAFAVPQWRGEPAERKTLLIHAEQGFGDTLQFCRYAALAAGRGVRVVLEVPGPLVRLLRDLPGVDLAVAYGESLPGIDLHCPMLSLPLAFGTDLASIPADVPYLRADPAQAARWQARLAGRPGRRVGLAWAGTSINRADRRRSLAPDQLTPLLAVPGIDWIALQKTGPAAPAHFGLFDAMHEMADFADTAALIANLDLVISVDTAVAHLAAALGKPVWLLDRFDHCWRWLAGREDSPWYPNLRIFRQPSPGDWPAAIGRAAAALRCLTAA